MAQKTTGLALRDYQRLAREEDSMHPSPPPKKNPGERDSPLLLPGVHTLELSNATPSLLKGHTNEMNDQRHQRSHNIKNKLYFKTLWQMSFSAGVHYAPARLQSYLWCLMGSFKNYTY